MWEKTVGFHGNNPVLIMSRTPFALVINPYATDFKLYDEWMHPLGPYFLIDLLQRNGYEVRFFNCLKRSGSDKSKRLGTGDFPWVEIEKPPLYRSIPRTYKRYGRPIPELTAFLESIPRPDLICIGSMMTYWLPGVVFTAATMAGRFPDVPMVVGGPAARLLPEVMAGRMPQQVRINTSVIDIGGVVLHPSLPRLTARTPLSLRPGLEMARHTLHGPILTSLGCPMRCSFCASSFLQGNFRRRDPRLVMDEITCCAEADGCIDLAFYDDALLCEPEHGIVPLLHALMDQRLELRLHAPNGLHLRSIDDALACLMKQCGFKTLRFGYESGAARHTRDISAKVTRNDLARKIKCLLAAGFKGSEIGIYVMAGLPEQTPEMVVQEIEFIQSLGVKAKPVPLSPVPGTRLFEHWARQFPRLCTDPLWHNDLFFITQLPNWGWDEMDMIREKAQSG
ncbi:MAG: radical SAM protein [Chitinispirillaceae bacterium]|nr:radical SAM protein [Chitinispirillaceae bacterium]